MKNKSFTVIVGLIVALLSVSVIAAMVFPEHFAIRKESDSALPGYTSPSGSGDQNGSADPHKDKSLLDSPSASGSPAESAEPPEDANLPEESFPDTPEWGSVEVYDGSAPIIRKMGEELRINALPHRKQTEKPPMSTEVFALWVGEMGFTVTSAELFDSIEETGLNYDEFIDEFEGYDDTYKPLVVELTVKNYNAYSTLENGVFLSERFMLSSKEEFSPEKFRSQHDGELRVGSGMPLVYVSPHSDGARDYFYYTLGEGETLNFTLCYYADTAAMPLDELYLEILTNSSDHRFGFTLDQLKGVE